MFEYLNDDRLFAIELDSLNKFNKNFTLEFNNYLSYYNNELMIAEEGFIIDKIKELIVKLINFIEKIVDHIKKSTIVLKMRINVIKNKYKGLVNKFNAKTISTEDILNSNKIHDELENIKDEINNLKINIETMSYNDITIKIQKLKNNVFDIISKMLKELSISKEDYKVVNELLVDLNFIILFNEYLINIRSNESKNLEEGEKELKTYTFKAKNNKTGNDEDIIFTINKKQSFVEKHHLLIDFILGLIFLLIGENFDKICDKIEKLISYLKN
jgi:hypothetical protein